MEDFVHLHVHSYYSTLDGMSPIDKMVDKAVTDGMRGMALTDHGNMFGIKELFDYCNGVNKKRKKEGLEPFKPIFGCEVYVAERSKEQKESKEDRSGWHLILLAKNFHGYQNLIKLVSNAWIDGYYFKPRTDHADLERYHEDLICCSACLGGEIPQLIIKGRIEEAEKAILWHKNIFGNDYYIELQRHEVKDPRQKANREVFEEQQKVNPVLIELARKHNIKLICSNDSHFVDEENAEAHDHLLCLATGKDLDDPTRMLYTKQEWFKTRAEMNAVFSDIPEALANTCEILDKVEIYNIESDPIMPFYPIPDDFGTEEEWRERFTEEDLFREFTTDENGENPMPEEEGKKKIAKLGGYEKLYRIKFEADYLAKLAYEGASRLYPMPLTKDVDDRIRFELHIMKTMGFPGYFLIVQDFINSARKELGVWVGPGRGSAAGSVVAYCLGITKLDPMKYDLLFERFLNPDRISLPDIDTDFDDDGRGKVLQWVMDKYGHENCAHIITYGTMAAKNSLKDVARVEKFPLDKVNALCKAMPDRLPDGMKPKLKNYLSIDSKGNAVCQELRMAEVSSDPREANTIKYARMLEGTVRGTGIHACGFIICRDAISNHVPVSTADDPDFPNIKTAVTQYDGHVIESTGLIKMDFLGLKTLSQMKECCRIVKESHGVDIDLDKLPIDDELTYKLYQEGRTVGTFQFESAGMQKYLRELHPTVFEDLIAMNALYRPGPMDYIPSFIARKNGREPITYDIPIMETYLKDTYGITVYQEQVMLLSRLLANFTRGESDALRKAMGKKKKDIVDAMKPKFIEGGKANGHDPKVLEKIWSDWEKFASYAFNKSHAACYSWVAYQSAYLKAHYPAEFMAALLTRAKDDIKEITKLMEECKNMGLNTLGPNVNKSRLDFSVDDSGNVRFGLSGIKGLGSAAVQAIISEREKNGKFTDIFDFVKRVSIPDVKRSGIECLAKSGAFDCFKEIHREQFFMPAEKGGTFCDTLVRFGQSYQDEKASMENSLFALFEKTEGVESTIQNPTIPTYEPWSTLERLNQERSLVGIYLSAHPLDDYSVILNNICSAQMTDLDDLIPLNNKDLIVGGMVTNVRRGISKRGSPYGIVTIEDYSGSHEFALFGEEWPKWMPYMEDSNALLIYGRVSPKRWSQNSNDLEFHITKISLLPEVKDELVNTFTITMQLDALNYEVLTRICEFANDNPGRATLRFNIADPAYHRIMELQSRNTRVNVTKHILDYLDNQDNITYRIN